MFSRAWVITPTEIISSPRVSPTLSAAKVTQFSLAFNWLPAPELVLSIPETAFQPELASISLPAMTYPCLTVSAESNADLNILTLEPAAPSALVNIVIVLSFERVVF